MLEYDWKTWCRACRPKHSLSMLWGSLFSLFTFSCNYRQMTKEIIFSWKCWNDNRCFHFQVKYHVSLIALNIRNMSSITFHSHYRPPSWISHFVSLPRWRSASLKGKANDKGDRPCIYTGTDRYTTSTASLLPSQHWRMQVHINIIHLCRMWPVLSRQHAYSSRWRPFWWA